MLWQATMTKGCSQELRMEDAIIKGCAPEEPGQGSSARRGRPRTAAGPSERMCAIMASKAAAQGRRNTKPPLQDVGMLSAVTPPCHNMRHLGRGEAVRFHICS